MANGERIRRSTGVLDHNFLVALVREQIRQVVPAMAREMMSEKKDAGSQQHSGPEKLRVGVAEAARIIGVSRSRLYKHIKEGAIKATKDGGRTLFTMKQLRSFVERSELSDASRSPAMRTASEDR